MRNISAICSLSHLILKQFEHIIKLNFQHLHLHYNNKFEFLLKAF